jgi:hypothetical protein
MHSHNRTLLASLGFADEDKLDPKHDLACRYIAQKALVMKLAEMIYPAKCPYKESWKRPYDGVIAVEMDGTYDRTVSSCGQCSFENPLSKGEGQYRTTIGFIDVLARVDVAESVVGKKRIRANEYKQDAPWADWEPYQTGGKRGEAFGIEVKITPVGTGEIIRQINLYRQYLPVPGKYERRPMKRVPFVLATAFPISEASSEQLVGEGINHVVLSSAFDAFCESQAVRGEAKSIEI